VSVVKAPRVSVVLPVYNQADHIAKTLTDHAQALTEAELDFELVPVVNGTQRDQTLEECQRVSSADPRVRVEVLARGGWGVAVRHGVAQARGDWICYTNSARTQSEDLVRCLRYATAYPGTIVVASRRIRESVHRRIGSVLYNFECRFFFNLASWDINGTPKVFPRTFERLLELEREDDLIDLEFHAIASREHYPLVEVPVVSAARHGGKSTTNFRAAWAMYAGAFALARKMGKPQ